MSSGPRPRSIFAEIYDYVPADSPPHAARLVALIREKCGTLREHPRLGRARPALRVDLRSLVAGRYVILYRVLPDAVEVVNVVHGSRDLGALYE